MSRSRVEKRNTSANSNEVQNVGDDTNVTVRARSVGQGVEEKIGSDEGSVPEKSEVEVEVDKLSRGRGYGGSEEGEGRKESTSSDHVD